MSEVILLPQVQEVDVKGLTAQDATAQLIMDSMLERMESNDPNWLQTLSKNIVSTVRQITA